MGRARVRIVAVATALVAVALLVPSAASANRPKVVPAVAQGKPWRAGVVPLRGSQAASIAPSTRDLSYGGGIGGVGVVTGAPQVYLVFWGSQWGTQSTNSAGNYTYSGDPKGIAPDLQAFFKGLGNGGETWSGVMTQYCQGVATGTQTCPSTNTEHVGYPTGGALVGVWEDTSAAAPSQATAHAIGVEAVSAANHFAATVGTASAFSPNVQYMIVSPTGTHPDGFNTPLGQFCAWHDYTGDSTMDGGGAVPSPNGPVAFTNMPYVTDAGSSCGENFVNAGSAGTLDGVTIVEGHEYAETITDTYPAGGWTDSSGYETGDKCAWIASGQGAAQDITLTTGSFAVQSTWANDYNNGAGGCEISHPIVTDGGGGSVTVTNPGSQTTTAGQAVSLQLSATESGGATCSCTWTETGLPTGLTMSTGGLISGTPTKTASKTVSVTATDPGGTSGSASFTWKIVAGPAVKVSLSPTGATIGQGDRQLFKATGTDQYGNAANMSSTAWSTTAPGTVSPATGSSSTFTASSTATGSGTVTATINGHSASANVTVVTVGDPIVNGGFESGSLSPWVTSGTGGAESIVSTGCHSGSYCAELGSSSATNGSSSIAQTFTAPTGATTLSLYYKVVCTDTVANDWATATLYDATTGVTYTVLPHTCTNKGSWVNVTHAVTAGHQYTLTLTNEDDNNAANPTYTLYDDAVVH